MTSLGEVLRTAKRQPGKSGGKVLQTDAGAYVKTLTCELISLCCRYCTKEWILRIWKRVQVSHLQR